MAAGATCPSKHGKPGLGPTASGNGGGIGAILPIPLSPNDDAENCNCSRLGVRSSRHGMEYVDDPPTVVVLVSPSADAATEVRLHLPRESSLHKSKLHA